MGSLSSLLAALLLAVVAGAGAVEFNATDFIPDAAAGVGLNSSKAAVYWGPWTKARATWYGQPNGAGPDDNGGACGFKHTNQYPFASMTSCGNQPLFKDGKGCGSCYKMHQGPFLLREDGDGDHHRHELLPGGALPLRPQRHGVRQARQARPQRQAAPLRHHRHRVHQGAMRVPGAEDRVPRGRVLEPGVLRGAGGVRGRRRRRGAGGPHGVADGAWAADWAVDADEGVVGIHLEAGRQPPAAGAVLHPHPQRVRQDAGRQGGHPGQLEAQHLLPLHRPVQLNRPVLVAAAIAAAAAAAARSAITIAATT